MRADGGGKTRKYAGVPAYVRVRTRLAAARRTCTRPYVRTPADVRFVRERKRVWWSACAYMRRRSSVRAYGYIRAHGRAQRRPYTITRTHAGMRACAYLRELPYARTVANVGAHTLMDARMAACVRVRTRASTRTARRKYAYAECAYMCPNCGYASVRMPIRCWR